MKLLVRPHTCGLSHRRKVIEDPERAAVRGGHEVGVLNHEIVYRYRRQVELQRLPVRTVVPRDINAELRTGIQQALARRVLAHNTHVGAFRNADDDACPGLAKIVRPVD